MKTRLEQQAAEVFLAGLDYDLPERAAFLDRACAADPALRAAVEALQAADAGPSHLSEVPPARADVSPDGQGSTVRLSDEPRAAGGETTGRSTYPHIEGYRITGMLGKGGMGVVYEAIEEKLNRRVALKLLPGPDVLHHPELAARFQREAAAVASLHHANIVPIYHFGVSTEGYYLVMELIEGQTLGAFIKNAGAIKGRTYFRQAAHWIADVADALYHAHLKRLIHRDIKPGNLMVRTDGRIVVLDFGLVKVAGDASITSRGDVLGTLRYMGPERQVGAKRTAVDARTDVYSLGATLYELLASRPAFSAVEESELVHDILFRDPTPPKKLITSVPFDLQTICLKAMEKDPRARYQTARVMADDLRRYLDDLSIVARPLGPVGRTLKLLRRRRAAALTGLSLLLMLGAVTSAVLISRYERGRHIANLLQNALTSSKAGHLEEAESAYRKVLDLEPANYLALIRLGIVKKDQYYNRPDPQFLREATRLLRQAATVKPDEVKPLTLLGIVLRIEGRLSEAIEAHEKAKQLEPTDFTNYVNVGAIHAMQGGLAEAEKQLLEAVKLATKPDDGPMPWRHLAAVEMQLGNMAEADESISGALKHGETDEASVVLQAAFNLQLGTPAALELALDSAKFAYRSAFDFDGRPRDGRQDLSFLALMNRVLAFACLRNAKWDQAASAATFAVDHGDDPPAYAHLILAIAEARRDHLPAAREHYEEAIKSWPVELETRSFRARMEGLLLWIDSAAQLRQLRDEARAVLAVES